MPTGRGAPVLIVGAGPVGMTLALDLAWRGIDTIVIEQRSPTHKPKPRANHVSSRAMETYRRLGIADEIRQSGLPAAFPTDVVWMTTMTGYELTRIRLPSRNEAGAPGYPDADWPTPEPQHKINQMYLEPILWRHGSAHSRIRLMFGCQYGEHQQTPQGVVTRVLDLEKGRAFDVESAFLVGCDGGQSAVRKAIGASFEGDAALTRVVSLHLKAPELRSRLANKPAHRYFLVNAVQSGGAVCLDGEGIWSIHAMLPTPDSDPATLDRDRAIRGITGLDEGFNYEIFAEDAWTGRRLLADRFRSGRVFLCGDAAHVWVPNAGYGMNAGIADAENLAWRLAALVRSWGGPGLLDGYERERRPITDQVSRIAKTLSIRNRAARYRMPPAELEQEGPDADAVRKRYGEELHELNLPQFLPAGLNFAYYYDDSPDIAYDGESPPPYRLGEYIPSLVPGCRMPHFFRKDGSSVYDALGEGFTLLRLDPDIDAGALFAAAGAAGIPLALLDIDPAEAGVVFDHGLVISRPDRHIAWRGHEIPVEPAALIGLISGNRPTIRKKS